MHLGAALIATLAVTLGATPPEEPTGEEIVFIPADPAGFGPRNVFAAITAVFGAWNYWYKDMGFSA